MKMIRNATGFLFGFTIAVCMALAMLPRAHAAAPPHIHGILPMIVAIDGGGKIVGVKLLGTVAASMDECSQVLKQVQPELPSIQVPEGVILITACVDLRADNSTTS